MKKVAIMQPYIFPYLGYFQLIKAVDQFVIYDDVQYIKGGWINRNNILISGVKSLFTIRLSSTSPNKLINEIDVVDDFIKFQKTLGMVYSKAPYQKEVGDLVQKICGFKDKNLTRFVANSFDEITKYLGIKTAFIYSSNLNKNNELKGQDKVIAICNELGASVYINSIGGQSLYNGEAFKEHGLQLKFLKTKPTVYKQFNNDFVPGLSIIDVMMFNSPGEVNRMLDSYELV